MCCIAKAAVYTVSFAIPAPVKQYLKDSAKVLTLRADQPAASRFIATTIRIAIASAVAIGLTAAVFATIASLGTGVGAFFAVGAIIFGGGFVVGLFDQRIAKMAMVALSCGVIGVVGAAMPQAVLLSHQIFGGLMIGLSAFKLARYYVFNSFCFGTDEQKKLSNVEKELGKIRLNEELLKEENKQLESSQFKVRAQLNALNAAAAAFNDADKRNLMTTIALEEAKLVNDFNLDESDYNEMPLEAQNNYQENKQKLNENIRKLKNDLNACNVEFNTYPYNEEAMPNLGDLQAAIAAHEKKIADYGVVTEQENVAEEPKSLETLRDELSLMYAAEIKRTMDLSDPLVTYMKRAELDRELFQNNMNQNQNLCDLNKLSILLEKSRLQDSLLIKRPFSSLGNFVVSVLNGGLASPFINEASWWIGKGISKMMIFNPDMHCCNRKKAVDNIIDQSLRLSSQESLVETH